MSPGGVRALSLLVAATSLTLGPALVARAGAAAAITACALDGPYAVAGSMVSDRAG